MLCLCLASRADVKTTAATCRGLAVCTEPHYGGETAPEMTSHYKASYIRAWRNVLRDPNSTENVKVKVTLRPTASRPVCPGVRPRLWPVTNFSFPLKFSLDSCGFVISWCPLWREGGSVIYCCCLASPAQSLSGLSPAGLKTIFYCPSCWDFPSLDGQVPVFISPWENVAQLYPRPLCQLELLVIPAADPIEKTQRYRNVMTE
jgi:hypothetical protein